jgi:hypothetical protein
MIKQVGPSPNVTLPTRTFRRFAFDLGIRFVAQSRNEFSQAIQLVALVSTIFPAGHKATRERTAKGNYERFLNVNQPPDMLINGGRTYKKTPPVRFESI